MASDSKFTEVFENLLWVRAEKIISAFSQLRCEKVVDCDDSYCSPAEDEKTAIKKSLMNLRDIEVRCMRAAPMCYISSSKYEDKGFYIRCAGAAASGGISLLPAFAGSAVIKHYSQVHILQSKYFPYLIGAGIGIVTFFHMIRAMESFIGAWYDEKAPKYNEAAAKWQELELRIKAFLAATVKDTITVQDCKQFTEKCAKRRRKICLIARPSSKIHEMYESDNELFLKSQKSLREIHKKRRENHLF